MIKNKIITSILVSVVIVPQITFASWWNPFTWNVFSFFKKDKVTESQVEPKPSPVKEEVKNNTNQATSTQENKNDELKDWKTYTNSRYEYTIKYPTDWFVYTKSSETDFSRIGSLSTEDPVFAGGDMAISNYQDPYKYEDREIPVPNDSISMDFLVYKIDPNISYDKFLATHHFKDQGKDMKTTAMNINGINSILFTRTSSSLPFVYDSFLIKKEDNMFVFNHNYNDVIINKKERDIFIKIISTFKFTDSNKDKTSDWKTYTNSQYGFEIKFPQYWEGYKTDIQQLADGTIGVGFNFPYTFNGRKTFYEHALVIAVYPINIYPTIKYPDGSRPSKIGENSGFVYSYSIGQDLGGNGDLEMVSKDMNQIISTFKLIK